MTVIHAGTTSVSVQDAYEGEDDVMLITWGYSKQKRPDSKQFLYGLGVILQERKDVSPHRKADPPAFREDESQKVQIRPPPYGQHARAGAAPEIARTRCGNLPPSFPGIGGPQSMP